MNQAATGAKRPESIEPQCAKPKALTVCPQGPAKYRPGPLRFLVVVLVVVRLDPRNNASQTACVDCAGDAASDRKRFRQLTGLRHVNTASGGGRSRGGTLVQASWRVFASPLISCPLHSNVSKATAAAHSDGNGAMEDDGAIGTWSSAWSLGFSRCSSAMTGSSWTTRENPAAPFSRLRVPLPHQTVIR